jgi:hypothetical protein
MIRSGLAAALGFLLSLVRLGIRSVPGLLGRALGLSRGQNLGRMAGRAALLLRDRLIMRLYEEFALSVSDDTIYRVLKNLGFSHVSARRRPTSRTPRPSRRSKNFAVRVAEIRATLPPGTPIEVWFQML